MISFCIQIPQIANCILKQNLTEKLYLVQVVDQAGNIVYSKNFSATGTSEFELDAPSGQYFVEIFS